MNRVAIRSIAVLGGLIPTAALAHTGAGAANGFLAGIAHPWLGPDHLLAMVLVGVWAGMQGRVAAIALPGAFLAAMALGAPAGMAGWTLPVAETAIAVSVLCLGGLIAANVRLLPLAGAAIAAVFAVAHGHAHGTEMPLAAGGLTYGFGFLIATAALHGLGVALGWATASRRALGILRTGGGAVALLGVVFLAGV